eukprot:GFYU01000292.1.p1 GENE.GFYU01000292.1~~GFYU01000292.1.p1  ORF type:complete len:177 (-),score=64.97 GFYU01000292.1:250-780(-)
MSLFSYFFGSATEPEVSEDGSTSEEQMDECFYEFDTADGEWTMLSPEEKAKITYKKILLSKQEPGFEIVKDPKDQEKEVKAVQEDNQILESGDYPTLSLAFKGLESSNGEDSGTDDYLADVRANPNMHSVMKEFKSTDRKKKSDNGQYKKAAKTRKNRSERVMSRSQLSARVYGEY